MRSKIITSLFIGTVLAVLPVISWASGTIPDTSMVNITGNTASSQYGRAIATGDFNNDGYMDTVVGTHSSSSTGSYITVIYGDATAWSSTTVSTSNSAIITGSGTEADYFGTSLAAGDTNGDGYDDILVGATGDTSGGTGAGAVWLIYGGLVHFTSGPVASDPYGHIKFTGSPGNGLGIAVAMGDLNNDGEDEMLLGGDTDVNPTGSGLFYVLYGTSAAFTTQSAPTAAHGFFRGESIGDDLGAALAIGDINGDGYEDVVAGAPGNDDGATGAGSVYIMYGTSADIIAGPTTVTTPEFTGEAAGDAVGAAVAVTSASMNGDAYNDVLIGAPGNDDGAANAGAVYMLPGNITPYSGTASLGVALEFTGVSSGDQIGIAVSSADFNQDGYNDAVIGVPTISASAGAVYIMNGGTSVASASVSTATTFTGASSNNLGVAVGANDTNGDSYPELLIGASGYSSNTGAVYVGYLYIDADGDGVPGTAGLLATYDTTTSSDCDDSDATVSENQTFWPDTDTDGLGDLDGTTTSVCASTAPDGYADNSSDTNDTIPNNGVEIDGDSIDNDGDTEIDEHNTIAENGVHPYYSTLSPSTSATSTITSVVGRNHGKVTVTYADNSVYDYTVFTTTSSKTTKVDQYKHTGYAVVLKKNGTKAVLLDLYTGDKADTQDLSTTATTSASLLLDDVRNDGSTEAVVTTKTKSTVKVFLLHVKKNTGKINLYDKLTLHNKNVETSKTRTHKKKLQLRSDSNKVLFTLDVSKKYILSEEVAA